METNKRHSSCNKRLMGSFYYIPALYSIIKERKVIKKNVLPRVVPDHYPDAFPNCLPLLSRNIRFIRLLLLRGAVIDF